MPGVNPPNNERLLQIIGDMQRQLRALATQQQLSFTDNLGRVFMTTGLLPGSNPPQYGLLLLNPANGQPVAFFGMTYIPDGSGRSQISTLLFRDDGTAALQITDSGTSPGHAHQQALQWSDRSQNIVIADDTISGVGIARPHIPIPPLLDTNTTKWPATTAATWTTISSCYFEYQQPKLSWVINIGSAASTNAQFQLLINGTQIGSTQSTTGGAGGVINTWSDTQPLPAGLSFGQQLQLQLQAQVTSGAGSAFAQQVQLQGQGS